ncbi:hypothetical protein [Spongiimicrobium sp. 3-5]|uniref:hypothetical protein n=1 Tax=Spongiimicrobium sp. 3-5 TaxID=3332596 RepID=UPI00397F2436
MKKTLFLSALIFLFSCNDGDLQIETIDFDSSSIDFCESTATIGSTIFFKINNDEALILELQSGILANAATETDITSAVPGQSKVTYRIFSENVTTNYFCDDIPPTLPAVVEEIEAEDGEVIITTVQNATDTTMFEHTIRLSGISFVNTTGERITDLTISEFGTITTTEVVN